MKRILLAAIAAFVLVAPASAATKHHQHSAAWYAAVADYEKVGDTMTGGDQASSEGYHRASGFEQTKAQCELTANSMPRPGYFAMGSPTFVGASSLGYGVGSMIRHAQDYNNCMTLHGYVHN
jgi:opacity protein-like surface antigen